MVLALDASAAGPVDFVAIVGDLAYAEGSTLVWVLWSGLIWVRPTGGIAYLAAQLSRVSCI